jgi:hypothetical protein
MRGASSVLISSNVAFFLASRTENQSVDEKSALLLLILVTAKAPTCQRESARGAAEEVMANLQPHRTRFVPARRSDGQVAHRQMDIAPRPCF